ncbi:MAG: hypothetical protein HS132_10200 [Planctomycetia bacterium]|nr:hypothetical protein [Planctomycetia bacterium]
MGSDGSIYIADTYDHRIRRVGHRRHHYHCGGKRRTGFSGDGVRRQRQVFIIPMG